MVVSFLFVVQRDTATIFALHFCVGRLSLLTLACRLSAGTDVRTGAEVAIKLVRNSAWKSRKQLAVVLGSRHLVFAFKMAATPPPTHEVTPKVMEYVPLTTPFRWKARYKAG